MWTTIKLVRHFLRLSIALLLTVTSLGARTLHVPSASYPTVQAALNLLNPGDTVTVDWGTYAEALHAPDFPFVLQGLVTADTGEYPRPVIDPSILFRSDTLACLTLPAACQPVIENLRFRNGPRMYPRVGVYPGGVVMACSSATFRQCVFDSVFCGIFLAVPGTVELQACRYVNTTQSSVVSYYYCPVVHASDCMFTGGGGVLVNACGGCALERCQLSGAAPSLCAAGGRVAIRDCQFGPHSSITGSYSPPLHIEEAIGTIENNLFTGLLTAASSNLVQIITSQSSTTPPLRVAHNRFVSNTAKGAGFMGLGVQWNGSGSHISNVQLDSNLFLDNHAEEAPLYRGIGIDGAAITAHGNTFHNLKWDTTFGTYEPPVIASHHALSSLLRSNRFDSVGLAVLENFSGDYDSVDARWNWWGDSTGPYNSFLNPSGLGDTVVGIVRVAPWCTDTLTCEEPNAVEEPHFIPHPSSFILSAYPNPFNSTATLHLEVPEAEIVRIGLFDILGRKVRELWSGAVSDEKEITFDGSVLASGVYFVRATSTTWNRPLVSTKIVLLK